MILFGISIIKITGFINISLLALQFLSGMHYIRVPWRLHKKLGILLTGTAAVHGIMAYISMI